MSSQPPYGTLFMQRHQSNVDLSAVFSSHVRERKIKISIKVRQLRNVIEFTVNTIACICAVYFPPDQSELK